VRGSAGTEEKALREGEPERIPGAGLLQWPEASEVEARTLVAVTLLIQYAGLGPHGLFMMHDLIRNRPRGLCIYRAKQNERTRKKTGI